jgi:hypothetical protein
MMKVSPFIEIAAFGHSNSQALHPVHCEAMILWAMFRLHSASHDDQSRCGRDTPRRPIAKDLEQSPCHKVN